MEPEFQLIKAMLNGREEQKLSQRELADRVGITQADISKMESRDVNPTLDTLKRIASGLGMSLNLSFTPLTGARKV